MPSTDLDLLTASADICYTYDARGRMLLTNEPYVSAQRPAPHLYLGRTATGYIVRFDALTTADVVQQVEELIAELSPSTNPHVSPQTLTMLRKILTKHSVALAEDGGPNYRFPDAMRHQEDALQLTNSNRELVRETFPWLYDQLVDWQPCFVAVRGDAAVAACFSARSGAHAAEAGVYTLGEFRGQGYARAVTTAWGRAIRGSGRIPLYSTSWENLASLGVARRIGLVMFGAHSTWTSGTSGLVLDS